MVDHARLDELRRQYAEQPRRYFAPLASALRRAGDAPAAVEVARRALAELPEHLTGYVILGQALADVGDRAGARRAFEHAHSLDEGNVVALQSLVTMARADGDAAAGDRWTALLREADPEPAYAAHDAPADQPDDTADGDFELLDYVEIAAPAQTSESSSEASVSEPDPVVGLDEAPADPFPTPMREALPALFDDATLNVSSPAGAAEDATVDDATTALALDDLDEDALPATPPAAPFVTETMAGLLAAQGHTAQARDVYAQLLAQRPGDARLLAQVAALRGEQPVERDDVGQDVVPQEVPHDARPSARQDALADPPSAASSTQRLAAEEEADERAARMWRAAFAPLPPEVLAAAGIHDTPNEAVPTAGPPAPVPIAVGAPAGGADPSLDDLSFDRFFEAFGEEAAPVPPEPTGDFERWAAEVDRRPAPEGPTAALAATPAAMTAIASMGVTASPAASAAPVASPAASPMLPTPDDPDADLAEFNAWLRSLAG